MVRIIDMECNMPRQARGEAEPAPGHAGAPRSGQRGYGMANYGRIFRSRSEGDDPRPDAELDAFVELLAALGASSARCPLASPTTRPPDAAPLSRAASSGLARISVTARHARACASWSAACATRAFSALGVSALVDCIPASDRRYYPLYTKAAELGIPVRIYSSMNYANDRPYDLGPPAPPRPGRHGFPGAHPHRRPRRLAVGQRDGRARAAASESAPGHLGPSRASTSASRARAGRC